MQNDWKNVPQDIKDTFERLGIPEAERKSLAGVGAQYDSELVYHNVKDEVAAQGVVYTDMESAMKGEYADMVRKYFMKLVTPRDHKFAALHGAVWSGGSFVYVPKGVQVSIPLQSYFRLNAKGAGQFEHTLIIVDEGASLHFIEGCSAPKYNVANLHAGKNTSSYMNTRSISKSGGISTFRSSVVVEKGAKGANVIIKRISPCLPERPTPILTTPPRRSARAVSWTRRRIFTFTITQTRCAAFTRSAWRRRRYTRPRARPCAPSSARPLQMR